MRRLLAPVPQYRSPEAQSSHEPGEQERRQRPEREDQEIDHVDEVVGGLGGSRLQSPLIARTARRFADGHRHSGVRRGVVEKRDLALQLLDLTGDLTELVLDLDVSLTERASCNSASMASRCASAFVSRACRSTYCRLTSLPAMEMA